MHHSYWRLRLLSACAALAILCCSPCHAQAADDGSTPAQIVQIAPDVVSPRPFGYVLGDVVTQRIALEHEGESLDLPELPALERTGNWFERRNARIEQDAAGQRWLALDYQVINVPEELRAIELPALDLVTTREGRHIVAQAQPLTVAPITPTVVLARAGLEEMRPDAPAPHIATAPLERRLHGALYVAGILIALWLALAALRQWRARRRLPFSRAAIEMRRLERGSLPVWRRLHRALDETAGQVVRGHDLAPLLLHAPWLKPMEGELKQFFDASQTRFFADRPTEGVEPVTLCSRAARLERRALA